MSRYVHLELSMPTLDVVRAALERIGLAAQPGPVTLEGSLECRGEPVDLRIEPGPFDTVEDFGFVATRPPRLVCGELDRERLEAELLPALRRAHAELALESAAVEAGYQLETNDGAQQDPRRLILRHRRQ